MNEVMVLARQLHAADPRSAGLNFDLKFHKRSAGVTVVPAIGEELRNAYIAQARSMLGI